MWNIEGKLNKLDISMFHERDIAYIENVEEYIETKKAQAEKIKELSIELENARNVYNDNLCEGINRLDYGKTDGYFRVRI
jgi:predicted hydrocarbon binding protein